MKNYQKIEICQNLSCLPGSTLVLGFLLSVCIIVNTTNQMKLKFNGFGLRVAFLLNAKIVQGTLNDDNSKDTMTMHMGKIYAPSPHTRSEALVLETFCNTMGSKSNFSEIVL